MISAAWHGITGPDHAAENWFMRPAHLRRWWTSLFQQPAEWNSRKSESVIFPAHRAESIWTSIARPGLIKYRCREEERHLRVNKCATSEQIVSEWQVVQIISERNMSSDYKKMPYITGWFGACCRFPSLRSTNAGCNKRAESQADFQKAEQLSSKKT